MAVSNDLLQVNELTKKFESHTILDGISFSIRKGEVVVLVGPSGSGKSTLLRCLNGLEPIQSGEILLDGQSVASGEKGMQEVRKKIGMVFQSYDLFPHLNVMQNITLAPTKVKKIRRADAEAEARILLERVGLADKENSYPRELSGGQKQRVAIVRALIMHPDLLLLDEITAALDPEMVREVLDVILDLARQGKTMLIVTHEMAFARAIADRILFLDSGHILENTTPERFFTHPETDRAEKFLTTFEFEKIHQS